MNMNIDTNTRSVQDPFQNPSVSAVSERNPPKLHFSAQPAIKTHSTAVKCLDGILGVPRFALRAVGEVANFAGELSRLSIVGGTLVLIDGLSAGTVESNYFLSKYYVADAANTRYNSLERYQRPWRSFGMSVMDPSGEYSLKDTIGMMNNQVHIGLAITAASLTCAVLGPRIKNLTNKLADKLTLT